MIPLPKEIKAIEKKGSRLIIEINPLYPGYGITIGNSLRRVLLSSLEGGAITTVKIKGVQHEFSTIPGVVEDVISIIINLKKLRFKMFTDEPQKGFLKVKGPAEVKGKDFELPSQVELVNKNAKVLTITDKKTEVEMEIQIEKGVGYEPVEMRKGKEKSEIGVIPIDAIYTPIKNVSFKVENVRVGKRTDFDKLFLDIETDGTLSPEEAFKKASEILANHFSLFTQGINEETEKR